MSYVLTQVLETIYFLNPHQGLADQLFPPAFAIGSDKSLHFVQNRPINV